MNRTTVCVVAVLLAVPAFAANPCEQIIQDHIDWQQKDPKNRALSALVTSLDRFGNAQYLAATLATHIDAGCFPGGPSYFCTGEGLRSDEASLFNNNRSSCNLFDYGNAKVRMSLTVPYAGVDGAFRLSAITSGAPSAWVPLADLTCANDVMYGFTSAGMMYVIQLGHVDGALTPP
jgi:hypothetical protein